MKIFAKIRFYWGAFVISFIVALLMIPLITIFRSHKGEIMHYLNRVILFLMGAKVEQVGEVDPDADMIVMNHQGIIDIIGMEALQKEHLRWVAKKELFDTPWFGYLLKNGDMISIDRENKKGLIKMIRDVKESLEVKHRKVVIFPEGTRATHQKLLPFKSGTKFIAENMKLKVQPVVITGSKWVLNEHNRTSHSGTVRYIYLPTVNVGRSEENWFEALHEQMQKEIDREFHHHHRSR
ncbi:lysophospholipid acyltransferase family protein [Sulfurovum sp.]|jgi:1-acyl-sn-glycerol-3-phosphate acyltransferase|uniref:lysophospholipid acyltransferase family protein n=1 Tax=Sulfurovum sp. TaxID=1969726 RepID=UPI002A365D32|nr:lysophospholipid acyltransferase family protein [Sulfurovum sp.]MDD2451077.1 lysophospholipid acyltransferase family protein [Sulfurovum sp.]MDD3499489.1 lysophospholipid acyltransferase family protein [Sulfurovum sp.]MDY0403817.1 lysophospholipid acyltransferase family protein [Sulfurovum sp.]